MSVRAEAEAVKFDDPPPQTWRSGAQRASSVTTSPAQGQSATRRTATQRHPGARAAALASAIRSGAHVTGQLPSIRAQQARVHEAAAEWEHWLLKYGRLAWGYLHLVVIKPALNLLEWVTETFLRSAVAALLVYLALKFH